MEKPKRGRNLDPGRIPLPAHDDEKFHLFTAELEFAENVVSQVMVTFGGLFSEQIHSELTAIAVTVRGRNLLGWNEEATRESHRDGFTAWLPRREREPERPVGLRPLDRPVGLWPLDRLATDGKGSRCDSSRQVLGAKVANATFPSIGAWRKGWLVESSRHLQVRLSRDATFPSIVAWRKSSRCDFPLHCCLAQM
jgi:hypothetical protein